ncbi:hypothetical protein ACFY93_23985 [Streptomyces sp. NPDC008313]|uniref:hypothetical protein n=1 Tax=Streptomyces sp. NPDC008313 TaxID=3364826 RepID=UPI0036DFD5C0
MHSESAIEKPAPVRGRGRRRGTGPGDGPVFVDSSGRRARLLRRLGVLVGVVCLGYAVVLGMAFMGWGTALAPSSLLPFGGRAGAAPGGGTGPRDGIAPTGRPTGAPPSDRPAAPSPAASASVSAAPVPASDVSASDGAN